MNVEALALSSAIPAQSEPPSRTVERERQQAKENPEAAPEAKKIQPEEVLDKIKALTEDGAYAVHFELDERTSELVVRLVDADSGEVIRQVPSEEILGVRQHLQELRGNLVNTVS